MQLYEAVLPAVVVVNVRVPLVTVGGVPQSTGVHTAALPDHVPLAPHVRVVEPLLSVYPLLQLYVAVAPSVVPPGVLTLPFVGLLSVPQFTGSHVGAAPQLPVALQVSVAEPLSV